eukprot:scaffold27496_cov36-Cyclotella_meneghiniana.AAC.1
MRNKPRHAFPIPYQVDFTEENKGRHLDTTKRKITWKFGFAHPPSVFPHLYDGEEYVGYREEGVVDAVGGDATDASAAVGVDCRGREHEIVLIWSLVSGKAHLYVDNKELFRHAPPSDEIFNPFSAQFHKGFNLPNSKYNGHHRIDIRCYSRTPLGAKNMVVDGHGGKFHQYDLSVDGLSYFSMPAMFELGTENMWRKIDKWGMLRSESRVSGDNCPSDEDDLQKDQLRDAYTQSMTETYNRWNAIHDTGSNKERTGRLVDEYHFDKAKSKQSRSYGRSISGGEVKAMIPRDESEEERMLRIAMEASMRDLDRYHHVSNSSPSSSSNNGRIQSKSGSARPVKSEHNNTHLAAVGENEDLIDFGEDSVHDLSGGVSQISFAHPLPSDVSVLGDDDVTVASFMAPMQQHSAFDLQQQPQQQQQQQQPFYSSNNQPYQQRLYQQQPSFQDPTFNVPSQTTTPRNGGFNDEMSFAYAPPPTWDDYKDAFGGSN